MKDAEKTDNGEEVKKGPDVLTLEGMLCSLYCYSNFNASARV